MTSNTQPDAEAYVNSMEGPAESTSTGPLSIEDRDQEHKAALLAAIGDYEPAKRGVDDDWQRKLGRNDVRGWVRQHLGKEGSK